MMNTCLLVLTKNVALWEVLSKKQTNACRHTPAPVHAGNYCLSSQTEAELTGRMLRTTLSSPCRAEQTQRFRIWRQINSSLTQQWYEKTHYTPKDKDGTCLVSLWGTGSIRETDSLWLPRTCFHVQPIQRMKVNLKKWDDDEFFSVSHVMESLHLTNSGKRYN